MKFRRRNLLALMGIAATVPAALAAKPKTLEVVNGRGHAASIAILDELSHYQVGKSGQVLTSQGAGKDPIWVDAPADRAYTNVWYKDEGTTLVGGRVI